MTLNIKSSSSLTTNIMKSLEQTLESSSIHAIPNIIRHEFKLVKIMWLLCFLASSGLCIWFMVKSINGFLNYEVMNNINIDYVNKIEYPIVSFCSLNKFLSSKNMLNNIIISCRFNSLFCDLNNDFEFYTDSSYGDCFRFNSQKNMKGSTTEKKYSFSRGFFDGFSIELFYDHSSKERSPIFVNDNGYLVLISNQVVDSQFQSGIKLSPGYSYMISLEKYKIKKQPEPYSNCLNDLTTQDAFDSECYRKTLSNYIEYKYSLCADMCLQRFLGINCNFQLKEKKPYYENMKKLIFQLNSNDTNCFLTYFAEFKATYKHLDECRCPLECESSGYSYSLSFASYPRENYPNNTINMNGNLKDFYRKNINNTDILDEIRRNVLMVNIYFDELKEITIRDEIKTSMADLISNLGGTLGVFLGLSFLSLVEFVEILLQTLIILYRSKKTITNSKISIRSN